MLFYQLKYSEIEYISKNFYNTHSNKTTSSEHLTLVNDKDCKFGRRTLYKSRTRNRSEDVLDTSA